MEKDVIVVSFENFTREGITLILNKKTSLISGNILSDKFYVSWDKIGKSLFKDYTEISEVSELRKLRGEPPKHV